MGLPQAHGQPRPREEACDAQRRPLAASQGPHRVVFTLAHSPASGPQPGECRNLLLLAHPEGTHLSGEHSH